MDPVELTELASRATEPVELLKVFAVQRVNRVVRQIRHIHAALPLVRREIHGAGCTACALRSHVYFAHEPALSDFAIRIAARLADLGCLEYLDAVVVAVAGVEQAVIGKLRAVQRAAEELGLHLALVEFGRPQTDLVAGITD